MIRKVEYTVPLTYVNGNVNGQEIFCTFMKKNCKKQIKNSLDLTKISRQ